MRAGRIAWTIGGADPDARRPRRHDARIVGRRHAAVGRLSRRRRVPSHRRSGGRPHLDRERAGRRRRDAGDDRRRRLRRRHPRAADSRSPDDDRQGDAAGHARHPARRSRAVPRALARAAAGRRSASAADAGSRPARGVPRAGRDQMDRPRLARLGRLPSRQGIPHAVRAARDDVAHRAGARDRSGVRLHAARCAARDRCGRSSPSVRCTCSIRSTRLGTTRSCRLGRRRDRAADRWRQEPRRSHVGRSQQRRDPSSARRRDSVLRPLSQHAGRSAAWRRLHAAREHAAHRPVRANGRVAGPRERGHPAHARPARAAIRSRRTTAINTARGSSASRRRFLPGAAVNTARAHSTPHEQHQSPRLPETERRRRRIGREPGTGNRDRTIAPEAPEAPYAPHARYAP